MDTILLMFKHAITEAVGDDVQGLVGTWQRCCGPIATGFFIAYINNFTATVAYRIVLPGCQTHFMRIHIPGIGLPAFGNDSSKRGISYDVDPWCGSSFILFEANYIFTSIF